MQDTGLFIAMLEQGMAADILSGNLGMYKGAVYENIVAGGVLTLPYYLAFMLR